MVDPADGPTSLVHQKSLPVVFGLTHSPDFARRFSAPPVEGEDLSPLVAALEAAGADEYARTESERLTRSALAHLQAADPSPNPGRALRELAIRLTDRRT